MDSQTIYIHSGTGEVHATNTGKKLNALSGILGTELVLSVAFHTDGSIIALDGGATGRLVVKAKRNPSGDVVLLDGAWAASGAGISKRYTFTTPCDSVGLRALLGDLDSVLTLLQVEWQIPGEAYPRKSVPVPLIVINSVATPDDNPPDVAGDLAWTWIKSRLAQGTNVTFTVNEGAKTITIAAAGGAHAASHAEGAGDPITISQAQVINLVAALAAKAPLASPAFSGAPTAPTAAGGTNTTQLATTAFVRAELAALVASSPSSLDTLNELATALGNDPNFASTITALIGAKAPSARTVSGTKSVSGGGDLTANRSFELVGDEASPGANKVYGTNAGGVRGWYDQTSSGSGGILRGMGHVQGYTTPEGPANPATSAVLTFHFDSSAGMGDATINGYILFNGLLQEYFFLTFGAGSDTGIGYEIAYSGETDNGRATAFANWINTMLSGYASAVADGSTVTVTSFNQGSTASLELSVAYPSAWYADSSPVFGTDETPGTMPSGEIRQAEILPAVGGSAIKPIQLLWSSADALWVSVEIGALLGDEFTPMAVVAGGAAGGGLVAQSLSPLNWGGVPGAALVARMAGDTPLYGSMQIHAIATRE